MKTLLKLFVFSMMVNTAHAAIIEANYTFDGTNLALASGTDVFNGDFKVGDTLKLSFSAVGDVAYWDFSGSNSLSFSGFDLGFSEKGLRAIDGYYRFYYDDQLVNQSYYYTVIDDYRNGPYSLSVRNIDFVDKFSVDYQLFSSTAINDIIAPIDTYSDDWNIFNTFRGIRNAVPFVSDQTTVVTEPSSLVLVIFCLFFILYNSKNKRLIN